VLQLGVICGDFDQSSVSNDVDMRDGDEHNMYMTTTRPFPALGELIVKGLSPVDAPSEKDGMKARMGSTAIPPKWDWMM
jgi:hypothetical protein